MIFVCTIAAGSARVEKLNYSVLFYMVGSADGTIFLIYAKLFPYTISNSESQTPLLRFLLRGGDVLYTG